MEFYTTRLEVGRRGAYFGGPLLSLVAPFKEKTVLNVEVTTSTIMYFACLFFFLGCYSRGDDVETISMPTSGLHGSKSNDIKCLDS